MIRSTGSLSGTPGKPADASSTFGGIGANRTPANPRSASSQASAERLNRRGFLATKVAISYAVIGDTWTPRFAGLRRGYGGPPVRRHRVSAHKPDRRAGIEERRPGHAQVLASQTSSVPRVRSVPGAIFTVPRNAPQGSDALPSIGIIGATGRSLFSGTTRRV